MNRFAFDESPVLLPRGAGALPPEVVANAHRRRLLVAMGQAVAEKGYVETTISDIVSRARVSRSAFYACFRDKEDCFLTGYAQEADRHLALIAAAQSDPDWWQQLRSAVHAYAVGLERHPAFARSFLIEILTAGPAALKLRSAVHQRYASLLRDWYQRAPAAPRLTPLPDEIFRAAVGAINELAIGRLETAGPTDLERFEALVTWTLRSLFGLREPAQTLS